MKSRLSLNPLQWDNENPVLRFARVVLMAAVSAAIVAALEALPSVDWPGEYDAMVVSLGTAVLAALDKLVRSRA